MFDLVNLPEPLVEESNLAASDPQAPIVTPYLVDDPTLAAFITKTASRQTYYTIRFLVDRPLMRDAYRAYAYFRWVDDMLDEQLSSNPDRVTFLKRQQNLIDCCYSHELLNHLSVEECILANLIQSNPQPSTGLEQYIRNMMAVMIFDAKRRGRLISEQELNKYSRHLATAVTEALHFFIGHDTVSPQTTNRYLAVTGAHITHMLRDTVEDTAAGYFNIPCEFLDAHHLDPCNIKSPAYVEWVKHRVQLARDCFKTGQSEFKNVNNWRRRTAGYAYTSRFEQVLNMIEKDKYQLRPDYSERKSLPSALRMSSSILATILKDLIGDKS
jgi:phytoene/squalene synthetase